MMQHCCKIFGGVPGKWMIIDKLGELGMVFGGGGGLFESFWLSVEQSESL